jgi:hypothetical protein
VARRRQRDGCSGVLDANALDSNATPVFGSITVAEAKPEMILEVFAIARSRLLSPCQRHSPSSQIPHDGGNGHVHDRRVDNEHEHCHRQQDGKWPVHGSVRSGLVFAGSIVNRT